MRGNKFKVYRKAGESRLYRIHPNGKVETSTNGTGWHPITSLNPKIINQWRRLGMVVKVANRESDGPTREDLSGWLARCRDTLMYGEREHLSQLIPMTHDGVSAYERRDMQTVRVCPTIARGYDEWSMTDGLRILNRGLSIPVQTMKRRRVVLNHLIDSLEQRIALM
ncbi:MAG: hypothetical protein ACRC8D_08560 [Aeromonas sp.]